ncbi:DUF6148 family protein [Paraburkholderia tropica]|uniref:DUF6148 family protein n=1 Tax=Paraburkholderia tropica TaxID=92647 RepID=UPI00161DF595|nr:DUF6148 family protein [Paraburkholderia tropica]MBB6319254.1 hypothetical protein [Paraburkholderia tropica]
MAGITLEQAQQQLDTWMAASLAVAKGQAYEIDGRKMTRANLAEIQSSIMFWDSKVKALSPVRRRGARVRYVVPGG